MTPTMLWQDFSDRLPASVVGPCYGCNAVGNIYLVGVYSEEQPEICASWSPETNPGDAVVLGRGFPDFQAAAVACEAHRRSCLS